MTNTPLTTGQSDDALAQLESLLQKTRAAKGQGMPGDSGMGMPQGVPTQPSPAEIQAQAEALAQAEAAKQAAFEAQQAAAEEQRQRELEEQRQKMAELEQTPQYQARIQQNQEADQKAAQEKAAGDGFEIVQIESKKI